MNHIRLIQTIIKQHQRPLNGIHGIPHWARVMENGRRLTPLTGAIPEVIELFALFHDAKRTNDCLDRHHGQRAAAFAASLRGELFKLSDKHFDLLYIACRDHTKGMTEGDVTLRTCWDADRLDLARVFITPDPKHLCTEAAKSSKIISWAIARSKANYHPPLIRDEWGCDL